MTISDWLIDVALVLVVFRQLREERLTLRTILLPLALIVVRGRVLQTRVGRQGRNALPVTP
ncbi:hypothetical protein [Streptomyces canus]|uniref:hypothetical protein n=1 Tax=Streptomyces canus TaxID=58343 RepID=UPI0036F05DCC